MSMCVRLKREFFALFLSVCLLLVGCRSYPLILTLPREACLFLSVAVSLATAKERWIQVWGDRER